MIGRPTGRLGHDAVEPELTQVDRIHEGVDHADGVVLVDPVIQALGKQRRLTTICTFNETPHPIPPQPSRNRTIRRVFTQPGSHLAVPLTSGGGLLSGLKRKKHLKS